MYPELDVNVVEYVIGGKMVTSRVIIDDIFVTTFQTEEEYRRAIKDKLAHNIAQYMTEHGMIEFTHLPQLHDGKTIIHARCYVAPNEQVKILRTRAPNGI
jgi:hypothetical protein